MKRDVVLRITTKLILPFILVFALYVQFHGDYGPGGGFQAGVIAAAAIILYSIIYGLPAARRIAPPEIVRLLIPAGVGLFAGVGVVTMFMGGNFLEYSVLKHDPVSGQLLGILLVELGILITVSGTMVAIFFAFVGRGR